MTLSVNGLAVYSVGGKNDRKLGVIKIVPVVVKKESDARVRKCQGQQTSPKQAKEGISLWPTHASTPARVKVSNLPSN